METTGHVNLNTQQLLGEQEQEQEQEQEHEQEQGQEQGHQHNHANSGVDHPKSRKHSKKKKNVVSIQKGVPEGDSDSDDDCCYDSHRLPKKGVSTQPTRHKVVEPTLAERHKQKSKRATIVNPHDSDYSDDSDESLEDDSDDSDVSSSDGEDSVDHLPLDEIAEQMSDTLENLFRDSNGNSMADIMSANCNEITQLSNGMSAMCEELSNINVTLQKMYTLQKKASTLR